MGTTGAGFMDFRGGPSVSKEDGLGEMLVTGLLVTGGDTDTGTRAKAGSAGGPGLIAAGFDAGGDTSALCAGGALFGFAASGLGARLAVAGIGSLRGSGLRLIQFARHLLAQLPILGCDARE